MHLCRLSNHVLTIHLGSHMARDMEAAYTTVIPHLRHMHACIGADLTNVTMQKKCIYVWNYALFLSSKAIYSLAKSILLR